MILDSLFRIAAFEYKKNNKLPRYVYIRREGFRHEYHIREVVALASKICGLKLSTGTSRPKAALGIIQKAARVMHEQRTLSPVAGFVDKDIPKVRITGNVNVIDLRVESCNIEGLALVRLRAAANDTARDMVLRPEHRYAAVDATMKAHLIIVEDETKSAYLQHFLARANISTIVVTTAEIEGLYTPTLIDDEWSRPLIATA